MFYDYVLQNAGQRLLDSDTDIDNVRDDYYACHSTAFLSFHALHLLAFELVRLANFYPGLRSLLHNESNLYHWLGK